MYTQTKKNKKERVKEKVLSDKKTFRERIKKMKVSVRERERKEE